jgi:hypothetical protein
LKTDSLERTREIKDIRKGSVPCDHSAPNPTGITDTGSTKMRIEKKLTNC